jgi:hypothetical protein
MFWFGMMDFMGERGDVGGLMDVIALMMMVLTVMSRC